MNSLYYVCTDDGDHSNEVSTQDHIFEALADYYGVINDGPEEGELEVEMGYWVIKNNQRDDMEPLLYHSFEDPEDD